jgi:hypothetical protein
LKVYVVIACILLLKTIDFAVNHVLITRLGGSWFISVSELADVHLMCINDQLEWSLYGSLQVFSVDQKCKFLLIGTERNSNAVRTIALIDELNRS